MSGLSNRMAMIEEICELENFQKLVGHTGLHNQETPKR